MKNILILGIALLLISPVFGASLYLRYDDNARGWYDYDKKVIVIFVEDMSLEEYLFVATHEYGHYVFNEKLTLRERRTYGNIYRDAEEYSTDYAKQCHLYIKGCLDYEEDFAESFASAIGFQWNTDFLLGERLHFFEESVYR